METVVYSNLYIPMFPLIKIMLIVSLIGPDFMNLINIWNWNKEIVKEGMSTFYLLFNMSQSMFESQLVVNATTFLIAKYKIKHP